MLLLDLANCGPSGILKVIYFFKLILDILFVIIPIALIILLIIDFSKAVISGDESAQSKLFKLAIKRILYAVILFCVPYIVSIFNLVLGELGVEYSTCYNDITIDAINVLEAEEIAIEDAKEAARLKKIEDDRKKEEDANQPTVENPFTPSGSGCDGMVYYENGVFYIPSGLGGKEGTKGSAYSGHNKYFYEMVTKFLDAAKVAGYNIKPDDNAWRDYYEQEYFYLCYVNCNCNNCNNARAPGTSYHNWGLASDIIYDQKTRKEAYAWGKRNAANYGLVFSVPSEDWHIEPIDIRVSDSKVAICK